MGLDRLGLVWHSLATRSGWIGFGQAGTGFIGLGVARSRLVRAWSGVVKDLRLYYSHSKLCLGTSPLNRASGFRLRWDVMFSSKVLGVRTLSTWPNFTDFTDQYWHLLSKLLSTWVVKVKLSASIIKFYKLLWKQNSSSETCRLVNKHRNFFCTLNILHLHLGITVSFLFHIQLVDRLLSQVWIGFGPAGAGLIRRGVVWCSQGPPRRRGLSSRGKSLHRNLWKSL